MKKTEIIKVIVDVLQEIQSISGRPSTEINANTRPISDLPQFDSLNGVEATVELSTRLGFDLPQVNAFINDEGNSALTVSEIADAICETATSKGTAE